MAADSSPQVLPSGDSPKYLRLAQLLTENYIRSAPAHTPLPTERELQENYGISRDTVRRAVGHLMKKGLVYNLQGSGTFVADRQTNTKSPRLISFTEDMRARGSRPSSHTLSCSKIGAPAGIARDLKIEVGSPVLRIVRLRSADGAPMALERAHFLPEAFAHLEPALAGSLDAQLTDNGYRVMSATQEVSATNLTKDEAELLQLPAGAAALRVHLIGYTLRGLAVESTETMYRADRYDYLFQLEREEQ